MVYIDRRRKLHLCLNRRTTGKQQHKADRHVLGPAFADINTPL
jgi:hypothetical protein